MPSGVTLAKSFYCSLNHFRYLRALIVYFTQICLVDVRVTKTIINFQLSLIYILSKNEYQSLVY
jgi:hypothetical protein